MSVTDMNTKNKKKTDKERQTFNTHTIHWWHWKKIQTSDAMVEGASKMRHIQPREQRVL